MHHLNWPVGKIIDVANELQRTGTTGASTSEQIAAAFVLNNMWHLPTCYQDIVEAWERLGEWQYHVKLIKRDYSHLIKAG
ncbi:hypothetical protein [Aliikangiella maris]|uniref:Uncharacterized protein n=1 Tax=Aliikangiella maris TaxID=3162458 RepID=A0ABV3MV92_9GAMM